METTADKDWASKYLLDPLTAPEPSDETGPGTHFGNSTSMKPESESQDKKMAHSSVSSVSANNYPTPPQSASPHASEFSNHRQQAFADSDQDQPQRSRSQHNKSQSASGPIGRRRGSSLSERFPGDMSHRPLDVIKRDSLRANRSRHLRKAQHSGSDSIDKLDDGLFGTYHHEGPYEAASMAKNLDPRSAPLGALSYTNREAIRATPKENVVDSLRKHRPLDGTAFVPSGFPGPNGKIMEYEEGTDMMRFNGNELGRWPGVQYHPEDLKGKGEPSYSIERALKEHNTSRGHRRVISEGGIEMKSRDRSSSLDVAGDGNEATYSQWASGMGRSGSKSKDFVKRLSSLRKRHARPAEESPTPSIQTRFR